MYTVMTQEIARQKIADLERRADAYRLGRNLGRTPRAGRAQWMPKSLGHRFLARRAAAL